MHPVLDVHHNFVQCDIVEDKLKKVQVDYFPRARRCSGYSRGEECKFSLLLDVGESEVWGGGLVTISHTCVNTENIVTECGDTDKQVTANGFLIFCDCVVMTLW